MAQVQAAQLLAQGVQDAWLSGEPQISFYRSRFKRHAPFASSIKRFVVPQDGKIVLNPKSDLLGYTYLTAHDPATGALVPNADWSNIVSTVELVIGNQTIATHDLTYINTIQRVLEADTYSKRSSATAFQPLGFFFDRQALPLVALKYSDVRINITWASIAAVSQYLYKCWSHCISLGEDEREFFASQRHQMLIPQLQRIIVQKDLPFHGPLKYIAAPCVNYAYVYIPPVVATGGTITTYSSGGTTYKVHTFTTTGTFQLNGGGLTVDFLVVGGGGSGGVPWQGGASGGGGGGGGQVVYTSGYTVSAGTYSVIVGDGGTNTSSGFGGSSTNGNVSSVFSITANGGLHGSDVFDSKTGGQSGSGNSGGSGGNFAGGGGGGGGQAANGSSGATNTKGGNGGNGVAYDISGTLTYYGGGGGGSAGYLGPPTFGFDTQGLGGLGGGGNGVPPGKPRSNGTANTGGGGGCGTNGGSGGTPSNSGYGGSGIVIIRYVA